MIKSGLRLKNVYEGCSGSSWNLVIKCSNIDILCSYFEISQVDIIELASHSKQLKFFRENQNIGNLGNAGWRSCRKPKNTEIPYNLQSRSTLPALLETM